MKRNSLTTLCLVILGSSSISLTIGTWFAFRQTEILAHGYGRFYPVIWRLNTILAVGAIVLTFMLGGLLILRRCFPTEFERNERKILALWLCAQAPALAVLFGVSPGFMLIAVIITQLIVFLIAARIPRLQDIARRSAPHLCAFTVIMIATALVAESVSPLHLASPLTIYAGGINGQGDVAVTTGSYNSYIWSHLFSFSDFDYAAFGAAPQTPTRAVSFIIPAIAFFAGLPAIDVDAFHRITSLLVFACFVVGSFGCYLLCRVGFRLRYGVSLFAGVLFVLGNLFFAVTFYRDAFVFVTVYSFLPFALLGFSLSLQRNSALAAVWSGAALAIPYYVVAPHPESAIEGLMVFGLIACALMALPSPLPVLRRIALLSICGSAATVFVAAYALPVLMSLVSEDIIVFGHEGIQSGSIFTHGIFGLTSPYALLLIAVAVLALITAVAESQQHRIRPESLAFLAVAVILLSTVWLGNDGPLWFLFQKQSLGALQINERRLMIYGFFLTLMVISFCIDALIGFAERFARALHASWFIGAMYLAAIALAIPLLIYMKNGPFHEGHLLDNPRGCSYQLSLTSRLADASRFDSDPASVKYIQKQLVAFESSLATPTTPALQAANEPYRAILQRRGVSTAAALKETEILPAAHDLAHIIDEADFGTGACNYPPMVTGDNVPKNKWTLRYNNDGLYADLSSRFLRIRAATGRSGVAGDSPRSYTSHLGIGPGLFLLDRSTYVDPRFMMSFPLAHALYLMPGNDFANRGSYGGPMNWTMDADEVLAPSIRHLTDISGVDVITIRAEAWDDLSDRRGLEIAPTWMPPIIDPHYVTVINQNSYGMAFLANQITSVDPAVGKKAERNIQNYFRGTSTLVDYQKTIDELHARLNSLTERHAVLIDNPSGVPLPPSGDDSPGALTIRGIIGPRAEFSVECHRTSCLVGFNMAAVPGWHVFVDGKPAQIRRINFAFLGVEVPHSQHELLFMYAPSAAVVGEYITIVAFVLLLLLSLLYRKKQSQ